MASLLTGTTRFWLATIVNLTREIKNTDALWNLGRQLDTHNPDTRLDILEGGMDLTLALRNLAIGRQGMANRISLHFDRHPIVINESGLGIRLKDIKLKTTDRNSLIKARSREALSLKVTRT